MILNDREIIRLVSEGMIKPFVGVLNPFGYDITLSTKFKFLSKENVLLDPFHPDLCKWEETESETFVLQPNSYVLGQSVEYFKIPRDVMCICFGRSSYARCGIISNVTPLEAGWEGYITVEVSNLGLAPVRLYPNKGIAQVIFLKGEQPIKDYSERGGKYHKQLGIQLSKGV